MRKSVSLLIVALFSLIVFADEFEIAQAALRDGLWNLARSHAEKSEGENAKLVILESFAMEGDWHKVLDNLEAWNYPEGELYRLYQSAALLRTGDIINAEEQLRDLNFAEEANARFAARIKSEIEIIKAQYDKAFAFLEESKAEDWGSLLIKASLLSKLDKANAALDIYKTLAVSSTVPAIVKRVASLKVAVSDLKNPEKREVAVKTIKEVVKDAPDSYGAVSSYLELAKMHLDEGAWSSAIAVYEEALGIWPNLIADTEFLEGRGWANLKLGKYEEAISDFTQVDNLSDDKETKSLALLKLADALSASGRGSEAMNQYHVIRDKFPDTVAAKRLRNYLKLRELEVIGRDAFHEYRFADAAEAFDKIAEADNDLTLKMSYFKVLCLYGQGRDAEAEALAKKLAEEKRDEKVRTDSILWLAKVAYNRGDWDEAESLFSRYVREIPLAGEAPYALLWAARAAFSAGDFSKAISLATSLAANYPESTAVAAALIVQGEALIQLARFDEAILVLERVVMLGDVSESLNLKARTLRADALFALGADNSKRYEDALNLYRDIRDDALISDSDKIVVEYKIARTLEKLKRLEEAIDRYYSNVVLAFHDGAEKGVIYDDEARGSFSKAGFRLANEYESRGRDFQAIKVLTLILTSGVNAQFEAEKQIERIEAKGKFL